MNSRAKQRQGLSLWTLVMLIFVPTFGFNNITVNGVALGPAAVPSWLLVSIFYFLPLTAIIAELASANKDKGAGIYSWIAFSLGHRWAFFGTWSYFIANFFYLQFVFSRLPVMASWALFGENRFSEQSGTLLPYFAIILCMALTWIATKGVKQFSKLSNFGGKFTFLSTGLFIFFAFLAYFWGMPSATEWTKETVIPDFSTNYFATFSWLLFAVAGAEVAGTYIDEVDRPTRNFPRGVLIATLLIAAAYILGSLAVSLVASPAALAEAGLKDANYIVYQILADSFGVSGKLVVQMYASVLLVTSIAAYVVWIESPIRAMFAELPENTFPKVITTRDESGSFSNALWIQAGVVIVLNIVPLVGLTSIDALFRLLTDLSALSLVIPYIILAFAFLVFRLKHDAGPFSLFKSRPWAVIMAIMTIIISTAGFFGAGIESYTSAESVGELMQAILMTYGGPVFLIIFGYGFVNLRRRYYRI